MGELLRHNGPALLACAVIVVRLARHRRHHRTATSTMGWIVLLAIALSLTVKAPLVYQAVSELTGIPNIGRLIDHGCILVAGWGALGILLHINHPEEARQRSLPHAVWIALAFTGMCVLFAFTRTPVDDVRFAGRYGRTPGVLEYWLVYLAGMLPAFLNSARLAARYAGMATDSAVRLGLRLISIGVLCSVAYHIHKGLFFAARRFGIHYPKALSMPLDRYLTLAAAILVLIGVTLPNWRSPDVFGACRKLLRLRPLWLALYRVNPRIALVPPRPLVLELLNLRDLELRLYRRVVEIRDGRLALREHIDPGWPRRHGPKPQAGAWPGKNLTPSWKQRPSTPRCRPPERGTTRRQIPHRSLSPAATISPETSLFSTRSRWHTASSAGNTDAANCVNAFRTWPEPAVRNPAQDGLRGRGLSRRFGSPGAGIRSGPCPATTPNRCGSAPSQSARAAAISSWLRPTKFHHITRSSANGSPPSRIASAVPANVSDSRPVPRYSNGPGVSSTSATCTDPSSRSRAYSKSGRSGIVPPATES